jgi:TatD DNase family protein
MIDIHTHNPRLDQDIKEIFVHKISEPIKNTLPTCVGIHPWFAHQTKWENFLKDFEKIKEKKIFFALGEIGIDKIKKEHLNEQINTFSKSLEFAKNQNIKRIIIHNVKGTPEILNELKNHKITAKLLIHDFNDNLDVYESFAKKYDTYISTGHKLFKGTKISKSLGKLPIDKLFFETDDQDLYSIESIYQKASGLLKIELNPLIERINANYREFTQQ